MKGIIYKATNKTENKCYIGQTIKELRDRINQHIKWAYMCEKVYSNLKFKFQQAIVKYGKNDFEWEILEEYSAPTRALLKKILIAREAELIKENDTYHNGYNSNCNDYFYSAETEKPKINLKEYLEFCSKGNSIKKQCEKFNCSRLQIKKFRKEACDKNEKLRKLFNEYDIMTFKKGMLTRNTYVAYGKNNSQYKEIIINEDEYIKKAKEGLNRIELATYFNIPENHIKVWRKRKIQEDEKYKKLFNELDKVRRFGTTAERKKLVNRLPKDIIDNVKQLSETLSMNKIAEKLNLSFPQVRAIKRGLGIGK
jgi:hypothetical protein